MSILKEYTITYTIADQELELLPERAIYWKAQSTLIVADLHIGKVSHFRKAGIAIPMEAAEDCLIRLETLINSFDVKKLLILGDLFHSHMNKEWDDFVDLICRNPHIEFQLVMGNHDILDSKHYQRIPLSIYEEIYELGPFLFSHDATRHESLYNIHGHIHPAVRLHGKGKQSIRLQCYFFGPNQAILPAFGTFTGNHTLKQSVSDNVFVIVGDKVMKLE